jgi:hypothetical protein
MRNPRALLPPRRRRTAALLCVLAAAAVRADMRLLATVETDSYRSFTLGAAAFCQAAGMPLTLADLDARAADVLLVPGMAGVDPQAHLWICWLMGDETNRLERSTVAVAILPTADNGAGALQVLGAAYPQRTKAGDGPLWRYARPAASNRTEAVVFATVRNGCVVASLSRAAAAWVAGRPLPRPTAATTAIAGQVRVTFVPVALAALLKAAREQRPEGRTDDVNDALERLLGDVDTLSLVLEAATDGATLRLQLAPAAGSPLSGLTARLRPPAAGFWRLPPAGATLAAASGGITLWDVVRTYGATNRPAAARAAPQPLSAILDGDSLLYVARTESAGQIYFAAVQGTTDAEAAWRQAQAAPRALLPFAPSFAIRTNGWRDANGIRILDLVFGDSRSADPAAATNNPVDITAFMLHDGGMSVATNAGRLVYTIGPSNAIAEVLARLRAPAPDGPSLPTRCRTLLPNAADDACSLLLLQPVALLRQIAESLPNIRAERLAMLPEPGAGIAASVRRAPDGSLQVALRVSSDELSRAQVVLNEGRAALQEMFMQMAVQQLLQRTGAPDPRRTRSR